MALGKKKPNLDQILKLVEQLSTEEVLELRRQLDSKTWGERFRNLSKEVIDEAGALSDEDIAAEVSNYRREKRAKGA